MSAKRPVLLVTTNFPAWPPPMFTWPAPGGTCPVPPPGFGGGPPDGNGMVAGKTRGKEEEACLFHVLMCYVILCFARYVLQIKQGNEDGLVYSDRDGNRGGT